MLREGSVTGETRTDAAVKRRIQGMVHRVLGCENLGCARTILGTTCDLKASCDIGIPCDLTSLVNYTTTYGKLIMSP